MYRFLLRPRWIGFHLLVVAAIVAMITAGFWQLRRLDQRQAFNAVVTARYDAPPVPLDALVARGLDPDVEPDAVEWRPVTASGSYLADEQLLVVNRFQGGRAGVNVVTPMRLDDGRILLVNRGFVPLAIDVPDAPTGPVQIEGRLRPTQERRLGQLSDPPEGDLAEVQRIDIPRLAPQLPGDPVPMYVDLIRSEPPEAGGLPEPVAKPDLSEGPHLSYAIQWFTFSAAVAIGWVLAVRRSIQSRRRSGADGAPDRPEVEPGELTAR